MIERFNFYDVYGYLVPGLALIALAWLPFALLNRMWPQNELLSAVAVLAFGYVLGHLLQNFATNAVPSRFRDRRGVRRFPSDILLDEAQTAFTDEVKDRISDKVRENFSLDLSTGVDGEDQLSRLRNQAFLMARVILIQEQLVTYAEQFEGLYSMMRGLSVGCVLGAIYLFGWALADFKSLCVLWSARIVFFGALALLAVTAVVRNIRSADDPKRYLIDRYTLLGAAMAACSGGYLLGFQRTIAPIYLKIFVLLGIACLLVGMRFFLAYRHFAFEFARVVWRDFAAHQSSGKK